MATLLKQLILTRILKGSKWDGNPTQNDPNFEGLLMGWQPYQNGLNGLRYTMYSTLKPMYINCVINCVITHYRKSESVFCLGKILEI